MIPRIIPLSKEFEKLVRYHENENLYLVIKCHSNANHNAWGRTNCNGREEALGKFLSSSCLEILNQGNEPNVCSGSKLEVIDITLESYELVESFTGWWFY